jgi:F-type H+-transporting ATPase subunit epsilon
MRLSIYTIENTLFSGEAEKVIAKTTTGEITVLKDHIPLISPLTRAPIRIVDATGKENIINIESGFIDVRPNNNVVILADN